MWCNTFRCSGYWTEWVDKFDILVLNTGHDPTWRRGENVSYLDITVATTSYASCIKDWRVMMQKNLSDNYDICYAIILATGKGDSYGRRPARNGF